MSVLTQAALPRRMAGSSPWQPRTLLPLLLLFGLAKQAMEAVVTLLSVQAGYGMFRDEFYYLVCGHRLALGYVDQPPLVALQARLAETLFGIHHLVLFRLLPGFAGALMVVLTGLIAHALGGGRRAAALAMLAALTTPVFIATQGFLSMNAWEPVFWMGAVLALLRLLAPPENMSRHPMRWWLVLGTCAGLGLENKASMIFFLAALLFALVLTPARRLMRTRGFLIAVAVTIALAAPNLYWQFRHGFPTWEWLRDAQLHGKDVVLSPPQFVLAQILILSPLHLLIWLPGALWLLWEKRWRTAGVLAAAFFALMMAMHAKDYYVAPIYPLLFAASGVLWERCVAGSATRSSSSFYTWRLAAISAYATLMTVAMVITVPFAVPVLSPVDYIRFSQTLHFAPMESERDTAGPLPEFFADFLGWHELADGVLGVYRSLPIAQQAQTGVFADNYGDASALNVLDQPKGLPMTISGHQSYWMWGPEGYTGKEMIVVTTTPLSTMLGIYKSCTVEAHQTNPYWMPWEQRFVYLCHDRLQSYASDWAAVKIYR
jgi:hypothetical protein